MAQVGLPGLEAQIDPAVLSQIVDSTDPAILSQIVADINSPSQSGWPTVLAERSAGHELDESDLLLLAQELI